VCSDEEDSAESTTDDDNVEDNTCQDATDERSVIIIYMLVLHADLGYPVPVSLMPRSD